MIFSIYAKHSSLFNLVLLTKVIDFTIPKTFNLISQLIHLKKIFFIVQNLSIITVDFCFCQIF